MVRMDRRALFTSATAATLLAATGVSAASRPRVGGRLRLALPRDGSDGALLRGAVSSGLTYVAPDGTLRGDLAASWTSNGTATEWRFDLGERPHFATDIAVRLHRMGLAARAVGEREVLLRLSAPNAQLPLDLAGPDFAFQPMDAEQEGAASGPYVAQRYDPDRGFLLKRQAPVDSTARQGWVDTAEAIVVPDAEVRAEALLEGIVDLTLLPSPQRLREAATFQYLPSADDMVVVAAPHVCFPKRLVQNPLASGRLIEHCWLA
jgi:ABC-type transport system substrate-binding protein